MDHLLGGNKLNDRFWRETLTNLARHVGVAQPIVETQVASASIRTVRRTLGAPFRKLTGRG